METTEGVDAFTFWSAVADGVDTRDAERSATVAILPSAIPDHVRIPSETPHPDAGRAFRVREVVRAECPACRGTERAHEVATLLLAGSELLVGMCPNAGWCVYAFASAPPEPG